MAFLLSARVKFYLRAAIRPIAVAAALLSLTMTVAPGGDAPLGGDRALAQSRSRTTPEVEVRGSVKTDPDRDGFDRLIGWAQIATAAIGGIGIPILIAQLWSSRRDSKSERTSAFAERYAGPDFFGVAARTLGFLKVGDAADCVDKLEAWARRTDAQEECLPGNPARPNAKKVSVSEVQQVFSFFEDFAAAYNRGDLLKRVAQDSFSIPAVQVFTTGWWFICWRRGGLRLRPRFGRRLRRRFGDNSMQTEIYAEFEQLAKSLRDKQSDLQREFPLKPPAPVIVLPHEPLKATDEEWARAKELSTALSERIGDLDRIAYALREPASAAEGDPSWKVYVVRDVFGPSEAEWTTDHEAAEWLAHALTVLDDDEVDKAIAAYD